MVRTPKAGDEAAGPGRGHGRRHQDEMKFYTITEVAEDLAVATRTVRRWIDARDLVAHHIGGVVRIAADDLRAFLALHANPSPGPRRAPRQARHHAPEGANEHSP
jgi:excisionase family DNA binding protein